MIQVEKKPAEPRANGATEPDAESEVSENCAEVLAVKNVS
jgi:hypothetical protein